MLTASQMIAKARNLPPVSPAALELARLLEQPDASNEDVLALLKQDGVLTAKLLRACNSPMLGLDGQVGSVDQAVLMLRYRQIFQMVSGLAFRSTLSSALPAYDMEKEALWQHSFVASYAAQLATNECLDFTADESIAFTVGLLHDIGKLITSQFITPEIKAAIRLKVAHGHSLAEAERCMLGADHAEVGAALLYIWRLPDFIVEAVAMHHRPAIKPVPRLSALASLANTLAHATDAAHCRQTPTYSSMDQEVFGRLGFPVERLNDVLSMIDRDCRALEMAG